MSDYVSVEVASEEAAALAGRLPAGVTIAERDEVDFWGRTYALGAGGLYVPEAMDPVEDFVARHGDELRAQAEDWTDDDWLSWLRGEPGSHVPLKASKIVALDLFAGCGGFSLGFHMAGIDVACGVEWDAAAAATYLSNLGHPDCRIEFGDEATERRFRKVVGEGREWLGRGYRGAEPGSAGGARGFFVGDVRKTSGAALLELAGVERFDVIMGGPPCQGLSRANAKACIEDPRNGMLWEFLRIVEEVRPKAFLIENVPGLLYAAKGGLFEALAAKANAAGYNVVANILDASGYGVPQYRRRAFVAGTLEGVPAFQFPMPTHWAIVRPVSGDPWSMRPEANAQAKAIYNADTGRWSAEDEVEEAEDDEELGQGSLFG